MQKGLSLALLLAPLFILPAASAVAPPSSPWSAKFDGKIRFHQTTELGALIVGTEKSLYEDWKDSLNPTTGRWWIVQVQPARSIAENKGWD